MLAQEEFVARGMKSRCWLFTHDSINVDVFPGELYEVYNPMPYQAAREMALEFVRAVPGYYSGIETALRMQKTLRSTIFEKAEFNFSFKNKHL